MLVLQDVPPETFNRATLSAAPLGVQGAFQAEHRGATVTSIEPQPVGNGLMFYRVTYIEDGVAGQTLYRAGGAEVNPAPRGAFRDPNDAIESARDAARRAGATTRPVAARDLQ